MPYQSGNTKRSRPFEAKWDSGSKVCGKCKQGWKKKTMLVYEDNVIVHANCPNGGSTNKGIKGLKSLIGKAIHKKVEEFVPEILTEASNKVFIPSVYQQAAINWAMDGSGHAVMNAVAGSGKTTILLYMLEVLPRTLRILYISFNRTIVRTSKAKIRAKGFNNIDIYTLNSKGFELDRKYEGFREMNEFKVLDILTDMGYYISKEQEPDPKKRNENRIFRSAMKKIVGLVKNTLADYNDPEAVLDIINRYKVEVDEQMEQLLIDKLPEVMEINNNDLETVDFDDQCYLPIVNPFFKDRFDQYDFILCDEFQDFNKCNIEFVMRSLAPGGRILAVGDHHQSINGFRGADTQAIPEAIERLQATTLPLPISYRCPRSHVELAKEWVPEMEAAPDAIEGTVGSLEYKDMMERVKEGDFVVCRTNAPLIKPAFETIRMGKKAIIRGKNIGDDLISFIERFQCDDLGRLDILMQEFTQAEIERWLKKNKEMMAEQAQERYQTIAEVMKECTSVAELTTKLTTLFSDDNEGVIFSSIHRIKGLESETVFWYRKDLCPHPKAKPDTEDYEQEIHGMYVAGTRSLNELYFVSGWE